jgi:hypothetical protein
LDIQTIEQPHNLIGYDRLFSSTGSSARTAWSVLLFNRTPRQPLASHRFVEPFAE